MVSPPKSRLTRLQLTMVRLACVLAVVLPGAVHAQQTASQPTKATQAPTESVKDPLGRDTPRGTLLGFMRAAGENNRETAAAYLNTNLRGPAAAELAEQLYVVLNSRLPARLTEVSDRPEGGLANPLKPDQDVIGIISTAAGPLDVIVERVKRDQSARLWLFSRRTLQTIPDVFDEINLVSIDHFLPPSLTKPRIAGVRLFDWIVLIAGVPVSYWLLGLFGLLVGRLVTFSARQAFPGYMRLLFLAAAIRWLVTFVELPLVERQFWSISTAMLAVVAFVWLLLVLNASGERHYQTRFRTSGHPELTALLRLVRRTADVVVLAIGALMTLGYLGISPTAALAGLGIGGIAVALAAQKTLENVIGGLSIIFDKAVRVGDSVKLGDIVGTVDSIGLRSTRIRTPDRTMLSVPNSQIANVNIETLSARDKFWFHHFVGLGQETTPEQMRTVLEGIRACLASHPMIDRSEPISAHFCRLGPFSLDIEVVAYLRRSDGDTFLEMQQQLLMVIVDVIERAGTVIARPSQTLHLANSRGATSSFRPPQSPPASNVGGRTLAAVGSAAEKGR